VIVLAKLLFLSCAKTGDKEVSNKLGRRISQVPLSAYACHRGREADSTIVLVRKVFDACHGGFLFFGSSASTAFAVGVMFEADG